jgi:hypothetical protein
MLLNGFQSVWQDKFSRGLELIAVTLSGIITLVRRALLHCPSSNFLVPLRITIHIPLLPPTADRRLAVYYAPCGRFAAANTVSS